MLRLEARDCQNAFETKAQLEQKIEAGLKSTWPSSDSQTKDVENAREREREGERRREKGLRNSIDERERRIEKHAKRCYKN